MEAILKCKGVISDAARMLGLKSSTGLRKRIKKNPILNEILDIAREDMMDLAESKLYDAIKKGDLRAVFFYLKGPARGRGYNESRDINITGKQTITFVWDDEDGNSDEVTETPSSDTAESI